MEYKFRQPLWNKKNKFSGWHYWGFIDGDFIEPLFSPQSSLTEAREQSQQYLRKDKNGTDIYSNMPIRYRGKDYPDGFVWDESGLRWTLNDGYYYTHYGRTGTGGEDDYLDLEIIHDNPELME